MTHVRRNGWLGWSVALAIVAGPSLARPEGLADLAGAPEGVEFAPLVEPLQQAAPDDDRVWEDVSYGTGEADFTAIAIDPSNPKRIFAGANGAVYASDDAGVSWLRVLRVRGSASSVQDTTVRGDGGRAQSATEDATDDAREEAIEAIKREITDDLVAELGDFGEQLAEEIAEELAEEQVDEDSDLIQADAIADNRGRTDTANPDDLEPASVSNAKAIQPRRVNRIYLLGARVLVASGSGVYVSKDGGETFDALDFGLQPPDRDVRALAVHPLDPNVIYAGSLSGVWFTRDGGETWSQSSGFPSQFGVFDLAVDPANPTRVLAATEQGIWRSTDAGTTFVGVHQPPSPLALFTRAIAFDPTDPRIVFGGTQEGLFRSLNGGVDWEFVESPGLVARDVQDFGSAEWGLVAATSNGVFLSADAGASFRELYAGLDERDARRVAAGVGPLDVYAATGRGLFVYRAPEARARKLAALNAIQDLMKREPPVGSVVLKALHTASVDVDLEGWRSRASWAPYAPRAVVRWGGLNPWGLPGIDQTGGLSSALAEPTEVSRWPDHRAWQVYFNWDAMRIMFPPETLDTSSTFRLIERHRARVLRRVTNTYSARRRLQIALLQSPPVDLRSLAFKMLQVDELTAVLDGLTSGEFSADISETAAPAPARSGAAPGPRRIE